MQTSRRKLQIATINEIKIQTGILKENIRTERLVILYDLVTSFGWLIVSGLTAL